MSMRINAKVGALAGLITGVVFALILQFLTVRTPAGNRVLLMQVIGEAGGTSGLILGWAFHLFDSVIMGAIFGALVGPWIASYRQGLAYGAFAGLVWWAFGGLFMMPILFGLSVFSPSTLEPLQPVALRSLISQVLFGLVFGAVFVGLRSREIRGARLQGGTRDNLTQDRSKAA